MKDLTRRTLLSALPFGVGSWGALSALSSEERSPSKKSKALPAVGEFARFIDPLTETTVVRLTSPEHSSLLPNPRNRFISVNDRALIFSSDRTGKMLPYHVDLRSGAVISLGNTAKLTPESLCLDNSGRSLYLIDEGSLKEIAIGNKKMRTLAEDIGAFSLGESRTIAFIRSDRLYLMDTDNEPIADQTASWCLLRPGNGGCLFGREQGAQQEIWYVALGAKRSAAALLVRGDISNPVWSPDGASILFLTRTSSGASEIHELIPETKDERKVVNTTKFAAFSPNHDGSVFVGASSSKAQPAIILLLRSFQRELTLCEHRASHPASVSPVFSPDSRRIFFQSDEQGKSAIYSVSVELLVEPANAGNVSSNSRQPNLSAAL